ncbi:hypothetical protein PUV54_04190 [Hyphococcus flavus]|uniref:Uncharacterized protein n=1 Tax=Hyphococcus flavus TaxID=1866326 RepID=A0AAE9ZH26_9PROT|nr:hypothetical protein [Hyphococcus flavus]WDI32392.1 hypothetical protein PUV54_04190 [Hyphococcus flavus]
MKVLGNLDWRHPLVRARVMVARPLQNALANAGLWRRPAAQEREIIQADAVPVSGDRTIQHRLVYKHPRPEYLDVESVLYTPSGLAVSNGKYVAQYSIRPPSTAEIFTTPRNVNAKKISKGTLIETETPYTYGDWVGDYVLSLVTTENIIEPLILPSFLAAKSYVIRDVEALGVNYVIADEPLQIDNARIIRKRVPSYYWGPDEVAAYRNKFGVTPPPAKKGSILYLARFDTVSEAAQRDYPSEDVADIVRSLGGEVFDTRGASPEAFNVLASKMETVIADQGSAVFGVMHSQTKNVIELAQDDWWHNANLFIANGAGVQNYAVIHIYNKTRDDLRQRIEGHLREFGALA